MPPEEDEPMEMKIRREQINESHKEKADRGSGRFNVRDSETATNREQARKQEDKKKE